MKIQTTASLEQLGVRSPDDLARPFRDIREEFDAQVEAVRNEAGWMALRDAWLGRKSGVLAAVTANWLRPAAPELKSAVGAAFNGLRTHVEGALEKRHQEILAAADAAAQSTRHFRSFFAGRVAPCGHASPDSANICRGRADFSFSRLSSCRRTGD